MLGSPARSRGLDSIILRSLFQSSIFCDSVKRQMEKTGRHKLDGIDLVSV